MKSQHPTPSSLLARPPTIFFCFMELSEMLIRPFWLSLQHDGREEQQQRQEVCAVNATEIWKRTTTPKTNKQTNKQKQKQKRRKSKRTKRASESKWRRSRSVCKMLSIPPPPPLSSSSSSSTHRSHSLFLSLSLCLSLSLSVCFCISYFRTKKKVLPLLLLANKKKTSCICRRAAVSQGEPVIQGNQKKNS